MRLGLEIITNLRKLTKVNDKAWRNLYLKRINRRDHYETYPFKAA